MTSPLPIWIRPVISATADFFASRMERRQPKPAATAGRASAGGGGGGGGGVGVGVGGDGGGGMAENVENGDADGSTNYTLRYVIGQAYI